MITIKIERRSLAEFNATLTRVAQGVGMDCQSMLCKQAMLLCQDLATFTPPMPAGGGQGLSNSAKKAGENAVAGDIRKIFIAVGDRNINSQRAIVFRSLAHATQTNNRAEFDKVLKKSTIQQLRMSPIMTKILNDRDYDRAFLKAKNYLSRVPVSANEYGFNYVQDLRAHHDRVKAKFGGRIKRGQRLGVPRMLVESKQDLDAYIKERQVSVGKSKAGWLRALTMIPKPKRANVASGNFGAKLRDTMWVARHGGQGIATSAFSATQGFVEIKNMLGNVNFIADGAGTLALALGNRDKQMKADLVSYIKRTFKNKGA
ncbi:MAG: hypothetical protein WCJ96_11140 [Verrucomicrobiota bacterium]